MKPKKLLKYTYYCLAIKVSNIDECEKVQKALFELGFKWDCGSKNEVRNLNAKVIFPRIHYEKFNDGSCGGITFCGKYVSRFKCKKCDFCPMGKEYDPYLLISSSKFFKLYVEIKNIADTVREYGVKESNLACAFLFHHFFV